MKPILSILFCLILSWTNAQLAYPTGMVNINTTPGVGIVEEIRHPIELVENSLYVNDGWSNLIFSVKGSEKKYRYPGRIDILSDRIELKDSKTLKIIQGQLLDYVVIEQIDSRDRYFVRNSRFKNIAEAPSGFYEVMNEGSINVLKLFSYVTIEPSYNPALDVGSRTPEIRKITKLFIMKDNLVSELPKKKKDIYELLDQSAKSIAKNKLLNPKNESDLIALVGEL